MVGTITSQNQETHSYGFLFPWSTDVQVVDAHSQLFFLFDSPVSLPAKLGPTGTNLGAKSQLLMHPRLQVLIKLEHQRKFIAAGTKLLSP